MICPQCGQYNEDNARFCGNCGTDLASFAAAAQQPAQPAQPSYQEPTYATAPSPYDTGVSQPQPQSYDYGQPQQSQQQSYDYGQSQQPQQAYAPQPSAPVADPYAQQPYQQQYTQGYNAPVQQPKKKFPILPVVVGVVAVVAVVGGFLFFRGSSSGGSSGGGTASGGTSGGTSTPSTSSSLLSETYSDSTYGYSYQAPSGGEVRKGDDPGQLYFYGDNPRDLWINTYVSADVSYTIDQQVAYIEDEYGGTVVEQGSNYAITVCTDPDGDTNYTKVVAANGNMYFMDVFYHPSDEGTMYEYAKAVMDSFTM